MIKKIIKRLIKKYSFLNNYKEYLLWKRRNFSENSPPYIKREIIKKYIQPNSIFFETGTYTGEMILHLHKYFTYCYTLEPSNKYFKVSESRLKKIDNKLIVNDTSENSFEKILKEIFKQNIKNVLFYLDGHFMGKNSFQGSKDTPIKIELDIISKKLNNFDNLIIIIDDFRLFGKRKDYPAKEFLINYCLKIKKDFIIEHDMFIIY